MAQRDSIFAPDRGPAQPEKRPLTGALLWTMTVASAAAVANIYYNQPLLAEMMRAFHASPHAIGLVATFTQVGYALGLPVFVPFGDFVERRRLVVLLFLAEGCSLIATAEKLSAPMPFGNVVHDHFLSAIANGYGDLDWSAITLVIAQSAGLTSPRNEIRSDAAD
jgi:MFS family permease